MANQQHLVGITEVWTRIENLKIEGLDGSEYVRSASEILHKQLDCSELPLIISRPVTHFDFMWNSTIQKIGRQTADIVTRVFYTLPSGLCHDISEGKYGDIPWLALEAWKEIAFFFTSCKSAVTILRPYVVPVVETVVAAVATVATTVWSWVCWW